MPACSIIHQSINLFLFQRSKQQQQRRKQHLSQRRRNNKIPSIYNTNKSRPLRSGGSHLKLSTPTMSLLPTRSSELQRKFEKATPATFDKHARLQSPLQSSNLTLVFDKLNCRTLKISCSQSTQSLLRTQCWCKQKKV